MNNSAENRLQADRSLTEQQPPNPVEAKLGREPDRPRQALQSIPRTSQPGCFDLIYLF
jgi:hypothetical protein